MKMVLRNIGVVCFPVILGLVLCCGLFALAGYSIFVVASGVLEGAVTGPGALMQTLRWTMPLFLIALGFMFSLRAGEFNIGGQGQMLMGGLGAVTVALLVPGPPIAIVPLAIAVGTLGGILWSGIAGILKTRFDADEVIVTLMLNFLAVLLVSWVTTGPFKDPMTRGDTASTPRIDDALRLSGGEGMSPILFISVLGIAVLVWLVAERTPFGLQSRYVGKAPQAAAWQGMNLQKLRMQSYIWAGALAGVAGAFEVLGPNARLVTGASPTVGFTALIVTVVGASRVPAILLAALFFGALQAAVLFLPIVSDLPTSGLRMIEGAIALLITAHFFSRTRG